MSHPDRFFYDRFMTDLGRGIPLAARHLGRIERLVPASERGSELIVTAGQHDLEPASICRKVPDGGSKRRRPRRNELPLFYGLIPSTVGTIRPLGDRADALVGGHAPINQIPRS